MNRQSQQRLKILDMCKLSGAKIANTITLKDVQTALDGAKNTGMVAQMIGTVLTGNGRKGESMTDIQWILACQSIELLGIGFLLLAIIIHIKDR